MRLKPEYGLIEMLRKQHALVCRHYESIREELADLGKQKGALDDLLEVYGDRALAHPAHDDTTPRTAAYTGSHNGTVPVTHIARQLALDVLDGEKYLTSRQIYTRMVSAGYDGPFDRLSKELSVLKQRKLLVHDAEKHLWSLPVDTPVVEHNTFPELPVQEAWTRKHGMQTEKALPLIAEVLENMPGLRAVEIACLLKDQGVSYSCVGNVLRAYEGKCFLSNGTRREKRWYVLAEGEAYAKAMANSLSA